MAQMKVAQISRANGPFEIVERPIPEPGAGRGADQGAGLRHLPQRFARRRKGRFRGSSIRAFPATRWPGVIDAVGPGVAGWEPGQRVGVGWNGGYCGYCDHCRRGDFFACVRGQVTGITFDGGYGEYMIAPASAVALMPDDLPPVEAAPLMCAGLTTFNALRNSGARPGDVVAVLGLGGLGHLGVQYAAKMGFHTVGIARGQGQGAARPPARRVRSTSTARRRTRRRNSTSWAAPRSSWRRRPAARRWPPSRAAWPSTARCWSSGRPSRCRSRPVAAHGVPLGQGLVFRHVDRLARHARVQRARRRAVDERDSIRWSASPRPTTA